MRPASARWLSAPVAVGAALALLLVAGTGQSATLRDIVIDGDLDDWSEVLLDRAHVVADRSLAQGDPDMPGQSQRDERGVSFTWDDFDLFLYFSRTGSGTNSFNAVFWIDLDHDRLLESSDRVAFFKFSGNTFSGVDVHAYQPLAAGGDPLGADGAPPPGAAGTHLTSAGASGAADASGIRFEVSLSWTAVGAAAGDPLFLQAGISSNQNLPGGLEDVTDPLDTSVPGVFLSRGTTRGAGPGRSADFGHVVTNLGTATDIIDLALSSQLGFRVEVHTDPDGDGDPADGLLIAADDNGDGDFTDDADVLPSLGNDANGDGLPDGGALAAGASRSYVLRVQVPTNQSEGTEDVVRLRAISDYRPSVRRGAEDRLRVGLVTVTPPGAAVSTSGLVARFAHEACNDSGGDRVLDVLATSAAGWSVTAWSDPDGDGDPADGAPLPDTDGDGAMDLGVMIDGTCRPFVVRVDVPAGTPAGASDEVLVEVTDGLVSGTALDVVSLVASRVDLTPDHVTRSQRGKTIHLRHDVVNADEVDETHAVSASAVLGSTVDVLDDPDGDSEPDDSSVVAFVGPTAPSGTVPILARIRIAGTAAHGDLETVTVTAVADGSGALDDATDLVEVAGLLSYADPLFARPVQTFFGQCATIYALAFRDDNSAYRFAWRNPAGTIVKASPELSPYADGSIDDFFDLGAAPAVGTWSIRLERKAGSLWTDVGESGATTFEVIDLVTGGAGFESLTTGSDVYDPVGEDFVAFSAVENPTSADVLDTTIDYVVFRDADGDGVPTTGEDWLQPDGTIGAWSLGEVTASTANVDVLPAGSFGDRLTVPSVTWSQNGPWVLEATWRGSCGFLLAVESIEFTVGCEPAPEFGGLERAQDLDPCSHGAVQLSWSAATDWGLGTGGTYAVYRSTEATFAPAPANLVAFGLTGTSWVDAAAPPDQEVWYLVEAESDVTCSSGPNNDGLLDGNVRRVAVIDADVGEVPVADFTWDVPLCSAEGAVTAFLHDASSGPPTAWEWDFDADGVVDATGSDPTWSFPGPGVHDVTLTVTNACGADTVTIAVEVHESPLALPGSDRTETCLGEPVDFDGTASTGFGGASLVEHAWDFDGDGVVDSTDPDPAPHSYATAGTKVATLQVTDSNGCTSTSSLLVEVRPELSVAIVGQSIDACTGAVELVASAAGGDGAYSYSFDLLADDGSGTGTGVLAPGTHVVTVEVIDGAGCVAMVSSGEIVIPDPLEATATWTVDYVQAGEFLARLDGAAAAGTSPYSLEWDVDDDGVIDGTGASFELAMGSNETRTVVLIATDENGCLARHAVEVVSGGCPVDAELTGLRVAKDGTGGLLLSWDASAHACHARYDVLQADTVRPLAGGGSFPTDPEWTSIRDLDEDGSDLDTSAGLAAEPPGRTIFFLVRDGGTDGTWGPVGHHGG